MRTFFRSALQFASATLLLFAASAMFVPQGPARADELDDQIEAMKDAAKDKDSGACIAAMVALQDKLDDRVNKALTSLMKNPDDTIAAAAIRQLGLRKDASLAKKIAKAVENKKYYKDSEDIYLAYLDAAAMYADQKNNDAIEKMVKKFIGSNSRYSSRLIRAYGSVREKETVDQLILWLIQAESTGAGQGGKNMNDETRENLRNAKSAVVETLGELTQQEIGDGKSWQEFWDKRRKNFTFPDPNAPPVDPTTLEEFHDTAYGYTVKKPEGDTWTFCDGGSTFLRMRLESRDPKDELVMARVDFSIHNLSTEVPKTVKELAKWYETEFAEKRISQASKEPVIEERKINGRDFTVVTARGDSGAYYSGWGTIEVRAYLTKVGHICVRFEALVRLGATDEEQAALWNAVESATWTDD